MVIRTFLDKYTTIVKDSKENFGLNPTGSLSYGHSVSRILFHFDIEGIKNVIEDGLTFKHFIKMKNYGNINLKDFREILPSKDDKMFKQRATSFDVIALKVPQEWDEGIGFDSSSDVWIIGDASISTDACNWYQSRNGYLWGEKGIYSINTINDEIKKYNRGEKSIVIGRQHFDHGNENLSIDITSYVNDVLNGEANNGICLCFSPLFEEQETEYTQYVGFCSNKTRTVFEPVVESKSNNAIIDNRNAFIIGKENKIYLSTFDGNEALTLDELPICTINDETYPVSKDIKGFYYANIFADPSKFKTNELYYDVWSNIKINNIIYQDIEMSFEPLRLQINSFSTNPPYSNQLSVSIVGINDNEKINRGDIREVKVLFRVPYEHRNYILKEKAFYRLYIKDGKDEIDIIEKDFINLYNEYNSFIINTNGLVPSEYYIDIILENGRNVQTFKKCSIFKIVSNKTNEKR